MSEPLKPEHIEVFDNIRLAANNGDLGLMSCTDVSTGQSVPVLFLGLRDEDDQVLMIPLGVVMTPDEAMLRFTPTVSDKKGLN